MTGSPQMRPIGDETFCFACHAGLACYTRCCANPGLLLTPYDILRLRRRLGLCSDAFVDRHAHVFADPVTGLPLVRLRMTDDGARCCPFLGLDGCAVYPDRPSVCRLYPLARASSGRGGGVQERYYLVREPECLGFEEGPSWTVASWMESQELGDYNTMNDDFVLLSAPRGSRGGPPLTDRQRQMYFMACYDLDRFRDFVFQSSFLDRFEVGEPVRERIRSDDARLLTFGMRWLRFALFGERVFDSGA